MPAKFLTAQFDRGDLVLSIHLDTSKVIDGAPDPAFVRRYTYGAPKRTSGEAQAAYRIRLRAFADKQIPEAVLLAQADATVVTPDPAGQFTLAENGTTF